jgi:hypothetical protein
VPSYLYYNAGYLQQRSFFDLSSYRIYTDLRLNPGNLNAFIKHENPLKISLDSAREVLNFVTSSNASTPTHAGMQGRG